MNARKQVKIDRLKVVFIISDRAVADKYLDNENLGVNYSNFIYAKGTASSGLLQVLGIGESEKVVNVCTIKESNIDALRERIKNLNEKGVKIVAFTVPMTAVGGEASYSILSGSDYKKEEPIKPIKKGGK